MELTTGMSRNPNLISEKFRAMGTDISIDVVLDESVSEEKIMKAIGTIKNLFEKHEQVFSRFRADSELSGINKNLGHEVEVSPAMLEVL
jgi:thiamine biosynthesis lipoprotein ApbE